jgi:hypothetical protein
MPSESDHRIAINRTHHDNAGALMSSRDRFGSSWAMTAQLGPEVLELAQNFPTSLGQENAAPGNSFTIINSQCHHESCIHLS